ncbi:MAG: SDR family oxidoreductase [Rhodospirillales bacterium]|nr:SDR family oxidoreductase [Rhodospirillales bacterium]
MKLGIMKVRDISNFKIGQSAADSIAITSELVAAFSDYSGDDNPLHVDQAFADRTRFKRPVAHGLSYAAAFSRIIGTKLPGPGTLWISQNFRFLRPVFIGDVLSLSVTVAGISKSARMLTLDCRAEDQNGQEVLLGTGEVTLVETKEPPAGAVHDTQRIALVVGGSRGIGAAVARRLDRDGFLVALTYNHSLGDAEKVAGTLNQGVAIQADAATPEGAIRAVEGAISAFGIEPDTVVFCASGGDIYGAPAGGDFTAFESHFSLQIGGLHALVTRCLDGMKKNGFGSIVAIGTAASEGLPPANMAPYLVSKAALVAYTRCLAVEYGHCGIRANLIAPGMTETSLVSTVPDRQRKVLAMQNPLRRLGQSEDVANAVSFLVSDDSAYISGEVIRVTGGS